MKIVIIAAVAEDGTIGNAGKIPWHISDDLKRFKRLTMGHPVIMGRATFASMGKPLAGRRNIVLTRDPTAVFAGCQVAHGPEEALALGGDHDVFVIGGAAVYALFLPVARFLYLTLIDADVPGDTYFPDVRWDQWRILSETACPLDPLHPLPHRFVDYQRIEGGDTGIPGLQFPGLR
jgi:dihydrofolate reductase